MFKEVPITSMYFDKLIEVYKLLKDLDFISKYSFVVVENDESVDEYNEFKKYHNKNYVFSSIRIINLNTFNMEMNRIIALLKEKLNVTALNDKEDELLIIIWLGVNN